MDGAGAIVDGERDDVVDCSYGGDDDGGVSDADDGDGSGNVTISLSLVVSALCPSGNSPFAQWTAFADSSAPGGT